MQRPTVSVSLSGLAGVQQTAFTVQGLLMPSHHLQALWGPSVLHTAQPTVWHAVSLPSCSSPCYLSHRTTSPQAGLRTSSARLSWEDSSASFSFLCTPSPQEVSHPHMGRFSPVLVAPGLLTPVQSPSGGATRASGPAAGGVAARMSVSPATAPARFCEEGLPAGSACSIVALPLQLASSLMQCLKIVSMVLLRSTGECRSRWGGVSVTGQVSPCIGLVLWACCWSLLFQRGKKWEPESSLSQV